MEQTYLRFVVERHRIWEARQAGAPQPWTDDPVLRTRKFTNVFRILDVGSQFLLRMMDESDSPTEQLVLAFMYRYTNRPEPFEAFREDMGRYPVRADLDSGLLAQFWGDYHAQGNPLFGTAYRMFVGQENKGMSRHEWLFQHLRRAVGYESDVPERFVAEDNPQRRHAILLEVPRCANFMGMQVLTDWNYLNDLKGENRFVVAGPGSTLGAKEIDPRHKPLHMIQWARAEVLDLPDLPLLQGRPPSYMDIQNTLCEFSKYVRYLRIGVPPATRDYRPAHPGPQPAPWLPRNWN